MLTLPHAAALRCQLGEPSVHTFEFVEGGIAADMPNGED